VKRILLACIRFYRKHISPNTRPSCRFMPTCSQYAMEAIEKYGALRGGWMALRRICCCHPFYHGKRGIYDPVP
jgi:putative membrane protein insertion efficiency factor